MISCILNRIAQVQKMKISDYFLQVSDWLHGLYNDIMTITSRAWIYARELPSSGVLQIVEGNTVSGGLKNRPNKIITHGSNGRNSGWIRPIRSSASLPARGGPLALSPDSLYNA